MICIPIISQTNDEALRDIRRSAPAADAIELRMDVIEGGDLPMLVAEAGKASPNVKIIVTCRRPEESLLPSVRTLRDVNKGRTLPAKLLLLEQAVALGVDFVDIEMACGEEAVHRLRSSIRRQKSLTKIIVSWHDIDKTPSFAKLKTIFHACLRVGADLIKIVPYARHREDNLKVLALFAYAKKWNCPLIAMCMGDEGRMSRVLAISLGSVLTFAVLQSGGASAPGQLTVGAMKEFHRLLESDVREYRPEMTIPARPDFVLLGNPVGHSLSPLMHNQALQAMGIEGHYSACCVEDLRAAITGIRGLKMGGASVTIPFKTAVMEFLDDMDDDAAALGAVNTIVNDRGRLTGFNTDWLGLVQAVKDRMEIAGKTFAVLGAGGTARAAVYGLQKEGGRVFLLNRTLEKGQALAGRFGCLFYPLSKIDEIYADCLINTTSVGLYPENEKSPVPASLLNHFEVVADVIYNPLMTRLLRDAEAKGCKIISGLDMFVYQGAGQIQLWTGREAPVALLRETVRERLNQLES